LTLFSDPVAGVSYLAGQVLIVAARYGSIFVAVSMVTATCFRRLNLVCNLKYVLFGRSFNSVIHFPSQRSDKAASFPNLFLALRIYLIITVTVASGKRSFANLKVIKTYLRSSIQQAYLNSVAIIPLNPNSLRLKLGQNCEEFC